MSRHDKMNDPEKMKSIEETYPEYFWEVMKALYKAFVMYNQVIGADGIAMIKGAVKRTIEKLERENEELKKRITELESRPQFVGASTLFKDIVPKRPERF